MKFKRDKFMVCLALLGLVATSTLRLGEFVFRVGRESLQQDFSSFYTAGESLNNGLSPYVNNILNNPPIWNGADKFVHSGFLYPPLAASIFRPLAMLPYHLAKHVWMFISIICLIFSLVIVGRLLHQRWGSIVLFVSISFMYFPLLTETERGQIDLVTLLILVGFVRLTIIAKGDLCKRKRMLSLVGGGLLSVGVLFKLHIVYVLPFLFVRKKWIEILGFFGGSLLIIVASIALNGPDAIRGYVGVEIPRISAFDGGGGDRSSRLDPDSFKLLLGALDGENLTMKDGRQYFRELPSLFFVPNASVSRLLRIVLNRRTGLEISFSVMSIIVYILLFLIAWILTKHSRSIAQYSVFKEVVYWQMVLVIILLSGPFTWSMNTVWLTPAGPILVAALRRTKNQVYGSSGSNYNRDQWRSCVALTCYSLGFVLPALPDASLLFTGKFIVLKYIIAECLVFIGSVMLLMRSRWLNPQNRFAHVISIRAGGRLPGWMS